jgi:hypothetical protein
MILSTKQDPTWPKFIWREKQWHMDPTCHTYKNCQILVKHGGVCNSDCSFNQLAKTCNSICPKTVKCNGLVRSLLGMDYLICDSKRTRCRVSVLLWLAFAVVLSVPACVIAQNSIRGPGGYLPGPSRHKRRSCAKLWNRAQ